MKLTNEWVRLSRQASAKVHINKGGISIPTELTAPFDGVKRVEIWRLKDRAVMVIPSTNGAYLLNRPKDAVRSKRVYVSTTKLCDLKGRYPAAWSEVEIGKRTAEGLYIVIREVAEAGEGP